MLLFTYIEKAASIAAFLVAQQGGLNNDEQIELADLTQQYSDGLIKSEDYENKKTEITRKYALARMDAEIESLEAMLNVANLSEEDRISIEKKIGDARLAYTKYINEAIMSDEEKAAKKREEIEKELAQKRKEILSDLYNSVFDLFSTLSDAEAEKKLQALDKEAESNQEWRDKETKAIEEMEESGAITKEQADARKAVVDQQAEEREKQIEQRRKLIEYEQAKREKAIALTQIAINTAVAISKALPNLLLVALVSALGAVQAATVLAQPLPAYKDGTKDHKGGWALTGDGYRHEMVVTPDGGVFKTPNTPTLMDLPKHSMVFPDFEKAILSASLIMPASGKSDMMVIQENKKQITLSEKNNNLMRQLVYGQDKLLYRSTNSSHASKINTGITNRRY